MAIRDIYLRIEPIPNYSPVAPDPMVSPPRHYARDCMRNPGHLDVNIPISEVVARTLTALVYREYLDPNYLIPKPDKLILADVNEPVYHRRVPGTSVPTSVRRPISWPWLSCCRAATSTAPAAFFRWSPASCKKPG